MMACLKTFDTVTLSNKNERDKKVNISFIASQ